jgi:pimeloyl-ACP methyl ester carboxylesterase
LKKTSIWRKLHRIWITTGATLGIVFVVWSLLAYRATAVAYQALQSDAAVTVTRGDGSWSFTPRAPAAAGLIFFPGGLVDPVAYAPLTHAIAASGYPSVLVQVPMRGAFGGADSPAVLSRALLAARSHGHVRAWVIAGHSRGGVIASKLARDAFPSLAGLVLIGTSHPRDFSLAALAVPVTRVYGTHDTIADVEKLERTRGNLPPSTRMVRIEGGNHSQFGYYGFQFLDWPATITRDAQQAITRQAVLDALAMAVPRTPQS